MNAISAFIIGITLLLIADAALKRVDCALGVPNACVALAKTQL